ncbi:hypothetical protein [Solemya pervernicosa gill symbiont]|nr:hypothetical protein [Solemya pervernicosa gill symbiont]
MSEIKGFTKNAINNGGAWSTVYTLTDDNYRWIISGEGSRLIDDSLVLDLFNSSYSMTALLAGLGGLKGGRESLKGVTFMVGIHKIKLNIVISNYTSSKIYDSSRSVVEGLYDDGGKMMDLCKDFAAFRSRYLLNNSESKYDACQYYNVDENHVHEAESLSKFAPDGFDAKEMQVQCNMVMDYHEYGAIATAVCAFYDKPICPVCSSDTEMSVIHAEVRRINGFMKGALGSVLSPVLFSIKDL